MDTRWLWWRWDELGPPQDLARLHRDMARNRRRAEDEKNHGRTNPALCSHTPPIPPVRPQVPLISPAQYQTPPVSLVHNQSSPANPVKHQSPPWSPVHHESPSLSTVHHESPWVSPVHHHSPPLSPKIRWKRQGHFSASSATSSRSTTLSLPNTPLSTTPKNSLLHLCVFYAFSYF